MGYEPNIKIYNEMHAKYYPDIRTDIRQLYIYETSGMLAHMIVGDKLTSLLRIVNVNTEPGDSTEIIYNSPMFKRVLAKEVSEIDIEIKTSTGKLVPFNFGEAIVTLVFRQVLLI
jgi:hypothetical protein